MNFISKYNILSACQYGFRAGYSTFYAVIDLVNTVSKHIDSGDKVAGLLLDISEAFDSLNQDILLKKLAAYGFRGFMNDWFNSYLSNKFPFVDIYGHKSSLSDLSLGVPQGFVLGSLLFLPYINDLSLISKICKFILFADDTALLLHEKSNNSLTCLLNSILVLLNAWFVANKLSLNLIETCVVPFNLKHLLIFLILNLMIKPFAVYVIQNSLVSLLIMLFCEIFTLIMFVINYLNAMLC